MCFPGTEKQPVWGCVVVAGIASSTNLEAAVWSCQLFHRGCTSCYRPQSDEFIVKLNNNSYHPRQPAHCRSALKKQKIAAYCFCINTDEKSAVICLVPSFVTVAWSHNSAIPPTPQYFWWMWKLFKASLLITKQFPQGVKAAQRSGREVLITVAHYYDKNKKLMASDERWNHNTHQVLSISWSCHIRFVTAHLLVHDWTFRYIFLTYHLYVNAAKCLSKPLIQLFCGFLQAIIQAVCLTQTHREH